MAQAIGWPEKYPWRLLPRTGKHPFVPPKGRKFPKNPLRGKQHGYVDVEGNEWRPHRGSSGEPHDLHWDVQHLDGTYTNVRLDGQVHHGPDNFHMS